MRFRELPESTQELEEEILGLWEKEHTFEESLRARADQPEFVFYEGPPTANGRPGVHHIISRTIKDVVARYRAMSGHHVTRIAGWDTHGLPVEIEAEKKLGISGKPEIERIGIERFNQECRDNIFTYQDEWERLSKRIGYWLDYERPYVTCSPEYIESVWWALAEIDRKGLLYPGYRVVPYCPRCGTGLSSHEVAQGYREVTEPSVTVKFHLVDDPDEARILSWTTTPWTLPGNLALAVGTDIRYVKVNCDDEVLILAQVRAEEVLEKPFEVLEELPGSDLVGRPYRPLFPTAVDRAGSDAAWTILSADFVTTDEGTGVVHTAVMYGEDDFALGVKAGLPMQHTVGEDGRFLDHVPAGLGGKHVKDPATVRSILKTLGEADCLYRSDPYVHSYPHCWRCDNSLLYMARDSWYIRTTAVKEKLLEHNAGVSWHPPEIGRGRMGEWLAGNVDWALSRDRYWGTPLPIWECSGDPAHRTVVGSFRELESLAGSLPSDFDPHRPGIDAIVWECEAPECQGQMRRVPQVADAWLDSGSMPYAQWHYPFANEAEFHRHFPADFIAEGVDQTRGWFYSLLVLSTLLFDKPAYRAVVVNDLILDEDGQKMSKSKGNVVDPWEAISAYGADTIRFYLLSVSHPWTAKRWDPVALRETNRKLFDTLRSTYRFFALYAKSEGWTPEASGTGGRASETGSRARDAGSESGRRAVDEAMDDWLGSRLSTVTGAVRRDLDDYDLTQATRRLSAFVQDDLSNWYVRQTRSRFWATRAGEDARDSAEAAFETLHRVLVNVALLLAPFAPFLADWLYRELVGTSVHLADFPEQVREPESALEQEMEDVRRLSALGRAAREEAGIRVRQPLHGVKVVLPGGRRVRQQLVEILRQELNVRRVVFLSASDEIARLFAKPVFSSLGPAFGSRTPEVARIIADLTGDQARELRSGVGVEIVVDGESVRILPEYVSVQEEASGEEVVQSADGYVVGLDVALDEDLLAAGRARELVNRIQRLRRDADLEINDRIELAVAGPEAVEAAAEGHREYISGETLAASLAVGGDAVSGLEFVREVTIDEEPVTIGLRRTER